MPSSLEASTRDLPATAARVLRDFVEKAREILGPDLRSVVLYGSAAEGRLRPTSDLNLILVLDRFDVAAMDRLRETLRVGQAAARLAVMFLLATEVPAAGDGFGETLRRLSEARETRMLPSGTSAPTLLGLVDLAQRLRTLVEAMR